MCHSSTASFCLCLHRAFCATSAALDFQASPTPPTTEWQLLPGDDQRLTLMSVCTCILLVLWCFRLVLCVCHTIIFSLTVSMSYSGQALGSRNFLTISPFCQRLCFALVLLCLTLSGLKVMFRT